MKQVIIIIIGLMVFFSCTNNTEKSNQISNQENTLEMEQQNIKELLFAYRDALNASDVLQVLPLYTQNGIFMPTGAPTSIGQEQVKGAYEFVFNSIQLNIEFFIDEISVNGDYAYARTTSKGSTLIHATKETVPEENRELFVLKKENGAWKIDRYMFNKMS